MMNRSLYCLFLVLILWSCKKDKTEKESTIPIVNKGPVLTSAKIEANKNPNSLKVDVVCTISGDTINALIPDIANNKKFVVTFAVGDATVTANDTIQVSGTTLADYSKPVNYKLTAKDGSAKTYKFIIRNFTGIPILYISTTNGAEVTSKDIYLTGNVTINTNGLYEQEPRKIDLQIKGRGNSTWGHPKKPYRLKFNSKAPMLEMGTAKNWVLLANYSDKTLIRTSLAFDLGTKLNADFTPKGRFVEVVMNNSYIGNYFLTSQVEVNENRVNIPELKKSNISDPEITGGYLLELDQRRDSEPRFETNNGLPFTIKSPEDIAPQQLNYIKNYLQQTENAIVSNNFDPVNGYAKYINVTSFINWFLVQELMANQDARDFSSIFYYKDRNGKLSLGPLWDFDLAAGNNDYSESKNPTGWWIKKGPWFSQLFKDPVFVQQVKNRWNAIKNKELKEIPATIDKNAAYIDLSQKQNFDKWHILGVYVWPNQFVFKTYPEEITQLKSWLNTRISWLDTEINKL